MQINLFKFFLYKICSYAKISSNIEGNACRSASDLISVWMQNIVLVNLFYKKYIVTIREFPL